MQDGLNTRSFVSEQASEYVFTAQRSGLLNACARSFCCVAEVETKQNNDIESKARFLTVRTLRAHFQCSGNQFCRWTKDLFFANVDNKFERMQVHRNMHLFPHTYQSTIPLPSSSVEKYASLVHPRVVGCADEYNLWHRRVICSDPICKPVKNAFNQPMRNAQYMQSARNPVGMKTQPIHGRNAISSWVTSNQDPTR